MRVRQTDEFKQWIVNLRDRAGRARVLVRVNRLIHGKPGPYRNLSHGVSELKIDVGPGYRVYYSTRGSTLIVLLVGGDKSSQERDVARAIRLSRTIEV